MINSKDQIVVLGGGLAGLTCAYELGKAKKRVLVIEKLEQVGGLAKTININGFRFDTGPHRWYTKSDMVNTWMLKLLDKEIIKVPRLTRIYFDKKFFHYPIQIKSTLKGMGLVKTFLAVVDYAKIRLLRLFSPREPVTIEEGYIYQFGRTLYEMFFKRYTEKLWGISCKKISVDWLGQRSRGFNIATVIKNAIFTNEKVVSFVDEFSYPKLGIGRLAEKLAEGILQSGGIIMLNSEVVEVNYRNNKISSVLLKQNNKVKQINCREIVSTIPISDLVRSLKPTLPLEILHVNHKLKYRDEIQVVLFVKKSHITPDTWIYIHSLNIPFVRFMEMDNWSNKLSPKGTTSLVFEIACNEGKRFWKMEDESLVKLVSRKFIEEFGLIRKQDIIDWYVHRVQKEYPVYHIGYRKDLARIKKYLNKFTNLQIAGRNGTFRYNNMDHSVEMGFYAAWNIIEGERKFDIDSVNIEREYLEEKKVRTDQPELHEDQYVEE